MVPEDDTVCISTGSVRCLRQSSLSLLQSDHHITLRTAFTVQTPAVRAISVLFVWRAGREEVPSAARRESPCGRCGGEPSSETTSASR